MLMLQLFRAGSWLYINNISFQKSFSKVALCISHGLLTPGLSFHNLPQWLLIRHGCLALFGIEVCFLYLEMNFFSKSVMKTSCLLGQIT